jgi:hypothetical protein
MDASHCVHFVRWQSGETEGKSEKKKSKKKAAVKDEDDEETEEGATKKLNASPRWTVIEPYLKSYLGNLIHFMAQLSDVDMTYSVLQSLEIAMPLVDPFPKLATKLLKVLLRIWSLADPKTRVHAFLRLRQLAMEVAVNHGLLEATLKGIYLTYVRNSKFVSAQSLPGIVFMANCVYDITHSYSYHTC